MNEAGKRPLGSVQYDHSGRVVIVTGGASGIGRAICEAFAACRATVVGVDVIEPAEPLPKGIHLQRADVSCEADCASVVQWTIERFHAIDVLVNNAAVMPPESYCPVDDYPAEMWQRMIDVDLSGYTYMAKHVLRQMRRQRQGVVVNIASAQGHRTARGVPAYGPIKAANIMQARQWAVEYARMGIRVVSVSPGAIDTPILRSTLEAQGGGEQMAQRHPLGRIGQPHEVAQAVLWLTSGDASFVTGTDLAVDGGLGAFGTFADPYPRSE